MDAGSPDISYVTPNLISVTFAEAATADPSLIIDGQQFNMFRQKAASLYYLKGNPSDLSDEDVSALNSLLDTGEGSRNRMVKKDLAAALQSHFQDHSIHVSEFGSGKKPILRHLPEGMNVTFHAVERDPACVEHLHTMDISASDWPGALAKGVPEGKPAIALSVYALHFMVNRDLPPRISQLVSRDGFFAANFYVDPAESESGEQRRKLHDIFNESGMSHVVLTDPQFKGNEYWVVSSAADIGPALSFAQTLKEGQLARRNRNLEVKQYPAPAV